MLSPLPGTWINAPVPHQPGCATKSMASATGDCLALACHDGPKILGSSFTVKYEQETMLIAKENDK